MPSATNQHKRRWQFGLRFLFLAIAAAAMLIWGTRKVYDWYFSVPLSNAVASFNERAREDPVGKLEPLLTEDEVISAIESQLPTLKASRQVKEIYGRIARTRRLPARATIDAMPGFGSGPAQKVVWWINLDVMASKTTGYGLRIRATNDPVAASQRAAAQVSGGKTQ
jgi:hypothetical protein